VGATAVLVSGTGSILEAIVEEGVGVDLVVADRPCRGLDVAARRGIGAVLVARTDHGGFGPAFDRLGYTDHVLSVLVARDVDLVCLAGFGTILAPTFFERLAGRVLNTHPSLLPAFPGWHAVRDALASGVTETGCTVHVATAEVDDGPILRQAAVAVLPGDDEPTLHERVKAVERVLYPATIKEVRVALDQGRPASAVAQAVPR